MDKTMELKTTAHLFDLDEMEKNVKRAQWYLLNVDNGKKSLKMTKLEIVMFINKAFKKELSIHEIDTKKIIAHEDVAFMILRDAKGDLQ